MSITQILYDQNGNPVHKAAGSTVSGSIGQVVVGLDSTGKAQFFQTSAQRELLTLDQKVAIAKGTISGSHMRQLYMVCAQGTANVWNIPNGSPTLTQITASNGTRLQIVSNNANDTAGGTGLRKLKITYLDANLDRQVEILTMNGTTPVLTTATNIRYLDGYQTYDSGTSVIAGTVSLKTSPDNVTLLALTNSSYWSEAYGLHYVARNKVAILTNLAVTPGVGNSADIAMFSAALPTDGRTYITSANAAPYYMDRYAEHCYFKVGVVSAQTYQIMPNEYVVQGPAFYWFQAYSSSTTAVNIQATLYEM